MSYCKFWIYWVGVNTKFTIWQHSMTWPRNLKIWRLWAESFLILIFYIKFFGNPTILNHSVISFYFNIQSNREFLRYKALKKLRFDRVYDYCKNIKFFQNVGKKTKVVTWKVHERNREGLNEFVQVTCFA